MVDVTCAGCGGTFEAKRPNAKWCSDRCRKRARRSAPPEPTEPDPAEAAALGSAELVTAVRRELAEADRLETYPGQLAMQLARRLVSPEESGISSLSKELRTVMDAALAGVNPDPADTEEDPLENALDEVARKRASRDSG